MRGAFSVRRALLEDVALRIGRMSSSTNFVDITGSDDEDDAWDAQMDPVQREAARREERRKLLASAKVVPIPVSRKMKSLPPSAVDPPPSAKRAKPDPAAIFVLVKGDWPCNPRAQLVSVKVLGTYSSHALADAAKAAFLQRGGWEEGCGYHQGEDAESRIEIYRSVLDAPAR